MEEHKRSVIGNHIREQPGNEPHEIAKNFRVLRKCSNKFDSLISEMFFIRDLKPKLKNSAIPSAQSCLFNTFNSFLILATSYVHFFFAFRYFYFYCSYVNNCFLLFIPLFQKLYICGIVSSLILNVKMTVERSKHCSYFSSLVFITKCLTKNLLFTSFLHLFSLRY